MGRRPIVVFWGAAAGAVLFLGSAWSTFGRLAGPHAVANGVVLVVALIGLCATSLVAGRIAFVVGRAQRRARRAIVRDHVSGKG
ncbi:MAG TPA: hypothetical protein VFV29_09365 [Actinomycetota bacterium]|nr:hypothetical protein [Actinomycetota bacterium]